MVPFRRRTAAGEVCAASEFIPPSAVFLHPSANDAQRFVGVPVDDHPHIPESRSVDPALDPLYGGEVPLDGGEIPFARREPAPASPDARTGRRPVPALGFPGGRRAVAGFASAAPAQLVDAKSASPSAPRRHPRWTHPRPRARSRARPPSRSPTESHPELRAARPWPYPATKRAVLRAAAVSRAAARAWRAHRRQYAIGEKICGIDARRQVRGPSCVLRADPRTRSGSERRALGAGGGRLSDRRARRVKPPLTWAGA